MKARGNLIEGRFKFTSKQNNVSDSNGQAQPVRYVL